MKRRIKAPFTKNSGRVFPKPNKHLRNEIINCMQPESVLDRESHNKIPIPYTSTLSGRVAAWVIPYRLSDTTSTTRITGVVQHYPFSATDLVDIYNAAWALTSPFPYFGQFAPLGISGGQMLPNTVGTQRPHSQLKLRVGAYYTYTVTNISSNDLYVSPYKIRARNDINAFAYTQNILSEYCNALWQSGIGTNVGGSLDEKTMFEAFHTNQYDFYDAPVFCADWDVRRKKSFKLAPGQSRTFRIKIRARTWRMRHWFNDFQAPTVASCPWVRFKGIPEYVFKYTTSDGGDANPDYYPADADVGLPDLSIPMEQQLGVVSLDYNIKYYVKLVPWFQARTYTLMGVDGVSQNAVTSTKGMIDTDFVAAAISTV